MKGWQRFRAKLPELLLEAASVVFAVLVALGVDEWRENRANVELAERARASILEEMRSNREELEGATADHEALIKALDQTLAELDAGIRDEIRVRFSYSLLSNAAWQTAQVTQAAHFMSFDWVMRVARVYDLQALYEQSQAGILERVSGFAEGLAREDPGPRVEALRGRVSITYDLHENLLASYDEILEDHGEER